MPNINWIGVGVRVVQVIIRDSPQLEGVGRGVPTARYVGGGVED